MHNSNTIHYTKAVHIIEYTYIHYKSTTSLALIHEFAEEG